MNKNCQLFYKRLRTLFPSIGFAEGKFLRDIKMQLRDYSIENPNAEYEDVVKFFGNPEDVYVDYIRVQGREEVYQKFHFREIIKRLIYRSEEHTSELQSRFDLVCRLLLEK